MTAIPDNVAEQAHCCIELIDVLTRRQDLAGREDLVSVAASLRMLVPPGTERVTDGDVLHLVEVFGVAMRVAGVASNARLPTVEDARNSGCHSPHAQVLENAARFFEWRSSEEESMHELVTAAIDVARVGGLLTAPFALGCGGQAMIQRAAANVIAATRVAVALADPDPGAAYRVWLEESRMRRRAFIEETERALAARRGDATSDDVN